MGIKTPAEISQAALAAGVAKSHFFVSIGNAIGGAVFVALFYFLIFRRELLKA